MASEPIVNNFISGTNTSKTLILQWGTHYYNHYTINTIILNVAYTSIYCTSFSTIDTVNKDKVAVAVKFTEDPGTSSFKFSYVFTAKSTTGMCQDNATIYWHTIGY